MESRLVILIIIATSVTYLILKTIYRLLFSHKYKNRLKINYDKWSSGFDPNFKIRKSDPIRTTICKNDFNKRKLLILPHLKEGDQLLLVPDRTGSSRNSGSLCTKEGWIIGSIYLKDNFQITEQIIADLKKGKKWDIFLTSFVKNKDETICNLNIELWEYIDDRELINTINNSEFYIIHTLRQFWSGYGTYSRFYVIEDSKFKENYSYHFLNTKKENFESHLDKILIDYKMFGFKSDMEFYEFLINQRNFKDLSIKYLDDYNEYGIKSYRINQIETLLKTPNGLNIKFFILSDYSFCKDDFYNLLNNLKDYYLLGGTKENILNKIALNDYPLYKKWDIRRRDKEMDIKIPDDLLA